MIPFKARKNIIPVITMTGLLAAASCGAWANGGRFDGIVVGVTDGDTVTVLDTAKKQHTIRLAFIDAPETNCHAKTPGRRDDSCVESTQPFGKASKKYLSDMIYRQDVRVEVLPGSTYGREIGVVYTMRNGREINANYEQVKAGMAWFYRHYAIKQMNHGEFTAFGEAETLARGAHTGLWSDPYPVAPWDYRHGTEGGGARLRGKMGDDARSATNAVMDNASTMMEAGKQLLAAEAAHELTGRARAKMRF